MRLILALFQMFRHKAAFQQKSYGSSNVEFCKLPTSFPIDKFVPYLKMVRVEFALSSSPKPPAADAITNILRNTCRCALLS